MMRSSFVIVVISLLALPALAAAQPEQDEVIYYHLDAIGSVRAITDASGQVLERLDFAPFGEPWPPSATSQQSRQFTGQERNATVGLDYFGARYYVIFLGRFTRPDDNGFSDPANPQTLALYGYVTNNPLRYIDPTGHEGKCPPGVNFCIGVLATDDAWETWLMAEQFFFDSFFNRLLTPQVVNFSAGLGDALLLGTGPYLRRQLHIDGVDQCSSAYSAGGWSSFAFGAARVGYAGLAKGASMIAASGAEASAYRHSLRTAFRLGIGKNWRAPNLVNKTDAQLRASAGKTNWRVNLYGGGIAAAGGAEGLGIGCGQ